MKRARGGLCGDSPLFGRRLGRLDHRINSMTFDVRTYYQNPLIEPLIIPTALAVHVASGIAKAYLRPASSVAAVVENQPKPFDAWNRDRQRATGYLLALIVPLHALATRGAALMYLDKPKEMGWLNAAIDRSIDRLND